MVEEEEPTVLPGELEAGEIVVESGEGIALKGDRYQFKVKITNRSRYTISQVTVLLTSFPSSLELLSKRVIEIPNIGPSGDFEAPTFFFEAPTFGSNLFRKKCGQLIVF